MLVQLTGALVLAAGVKPAFELQDYQIVGLGSVIMRVAMIGQLARAIRGAPGDRAGLVPYAGSLAVLQTLRVVLLLSPSMFPAPDKIVLGATQITAILWSESLTRTWHPAHIAQRYGLLTIIVLGETVPAAALAMQTIVEAGEITVGLVPTILGGRTYILFDVVALF